MTRPFNLVKSKEVVNVAVKNMDKENLGKIEEIVIDKLTGKVVYIVLNSGSFLGLGGKLFALPWNSITYDPQESCFIFDITKEELKKAPGFDADHWPDMADKTWTRLITEYYGEKDYIE